ncbi:MAG: winged helix-turn-helix transcriptional regulator [Deltaproteobacteria bacterium]|nr:winged helix-turn-helix transcriptional regulator [Deltaproteobacteria bacterium]MBW1993135.1 winged helix-turn-helix transcriptional regulator [Deltaproteobacteria bacterium]MBW2152505.1 winged helix-turn-helix transcriptional regulator [Deltaproteobacteria bacterium]
MSPFSTCFKALGDATRFKIIELLLGHDLCVGALARRLKVSEAAISQHLRVLREAGLVRGEKRGYWTHYTVKTDVLEKIADDLKQMAAREKASEGVCFRTSPQTNKQTTKGVIHMCKDCCEHPEKLKGKPEDCSPEQIRECHGDTREHPCETEKK